MYDRPAASLFRRVSDLTSCLNFYLCCPVRDQAAKRPVIRSRTGRSTLALIEEGTIFLSAFELLQDPFHLPPV